MCILQSCSFESFQKGVTAEKRQYPRASWVVINSQRTRIRGLFRFSDLDDITDYPIDHVAYILTL